MKRYLKYILLPLVTGLLTVSCLEEIEAPQPVFESEEVTLVPRVKSFTNQYVTKAEGDEAAYTQAETKITHLAYLIFNSEGVLVHKDEADVQNGVGLTLNKTNLNSAETAATVVMFANVNLADIKKANEDGSFTAISNTLTIEEFDDYSIHLTNAPIVLSTDLSNTGFKGFPMKGVAEGVDLTTSSKDPIVVSLQILYAKVNFEISVAAGTENQNYQGVTPSFTLSGYSVTNVPTSTPVKSLNDDETIGAVESTPDGTLYEYTGTEDDPSKTVSTNSSTFTFYMAESRYNHGGTDGVYPADLPDENRQQYKPLLATSGTGSPATGLATYVTVNGTYIDYRGTSWTVNYKVYLGKNSYDNFHVDRNSEYKNYLTIKGIRNNSSYGEGDVWIDHRVDVSTDDTAKYITITRETLIDSHIEVRPLRVKWEENVDKQESEYDRVHMYLPADQSNQLLNWIGIEKFTGDNCQDGATYCSLKGISTGKRKYFTTSLINELQTMNGDMGVKTDANGRKFLDLYNGHCAWIYFDENNTTSAREAELRLDFYVGEDIVATESYKITQRGLQTIGDYYVESYEEYLHSYDSADKYNLSTSPVDYTQQGLSWGLEGDTISEDIIVTTLANLGDLTSQRYDYFHSSDGSGYYTYTRNANGDFSLLRDNPTNFGDGLIFTDRASTKRKITIKDMGTIPSNAYQYCLSKNKFHEDPDENHTLDIHWYLPDVHELQNVLQASVTDNASVDFNSEAKYWSSQPAFTGTTYIDENSNEARAVSIHGITSVSRNAQNRIRCFYSSEGITGVDMKERVPDGLGGNYTFVMKGKPMDGYFHNLLEGKTVTSPETVTSDYPNAWYEYPTNENSNSTTEFKYITVVDKGNNNRTGFDRNPAEIGNWNEYLIDFGDRLGTYATGYYYTLDTYPGLIANTREKVGRSILDIGIDVPILGHVSLLKIAEYLNIDVDQWILVDAYKSTETPLSETQTMGSSTIIDLTDEPIPAASYLRPLDHASNNRLKISFSGANGANHKPDFEYYELVNKTTSTNTRYWVPPTYQANTYELKGESKTFYATGTGSADGTSTAFGSLNTARQYAFEGNASNLWNGAKEKARKDALAKLKENITSDYLQYYNENNVVWDPDIDLVTWKSASPTVVYSNESSTWAGHRTTCTVTLNVSITISKASEITLYSEVAGTGQWGSPVPNQSTHEGPTLTYDELRIYSGNSFTISCTDPNYEITKVRVYFSGSNQIEDGTSTDYFARFVDAEINLDTPIAGDESSHLFGMEYNDADGWHQWSGSGEQSVTLNLADYELTANFDLNNMTLEDFLSGNWGTAVTYDYKYQKASRNLSYYLVVDRIEVKCTKKASTATE